MHAVPGAIDMVPSLAELLAQIREETITECIDEIEEYGNGRPSINTGPGLWKAIDLLRALPSESSSQSQEKP